jgi:hypothetical protein
MRASQIKTLKMGRKWKKKKNIETILCAAVGTASHQHSLDIRNICGRFDSLLKNDKSLPDV